MLGPLKNRRKTWLLSAVIKTFSWPGIYMRVTSETVTNEFTKNSKSIRCFLNLPQYNSAAGDFFSGTLHTLIRESQTTGFCFAAQSEHLTKRSLPWQNAGNQWHRLWDLQLNWCVYSTCSTSVFVIYGKPNAVVLNESLLGLHEFILPESALFLLTRPNKLQFGCLHGVH